MKKLEWSFHNQLQKKNGVWKLSRPYFLLIVFVIILLVINYFMIQQYVILRCYEYKTDKIIFEKVINRQESFTMSFTHSVSKQPVVEVYHITVENKLALKEMKFNHFSANLPVDSEVAGTEKTEFIIEGNSYRVIGFEREMEELLLSLGVELKSHKVFFKDGTEIAISQKADNPIAVIEAVPLPIWKLFLIRR